MHISIRYISNQTLLYENHYGGLFVEGAEPVFIKKTKIPGVHMRLAISNFQYKFVEPE